MANNDRLFNFGFMALCLLVLFAFCNLAVFYGFYNYLATLPIPAGWRGVLIGLLNVSALIFRPVLSPFLTSQNAIQGIAAGLFMIVVSLSLYALGDSLFFLIALRIFHGLGYVMLVSSSVTLLMVFMPAKNSGQGFGIISIMTLLPYAILPLIVEQVAATVSQPVIYACTAVLMLPCGLLLIPLSRRLSLQKEAEDFSRIKLPKGSILANLRQKKIILVLLVNGLVFSVYALVFFFLKTFSAQMGLGDVGLFFSVSTLVMILIRFVLGPLFDRFDKAIMSILSLVVFAVGLGLLGFVDSIMQFYGIAVLYGMGMGAASPLLNGLMFMISDPRFRGLNTNLMLEMVDAGFFVGPLAGSLAVAGFRPEVILICCAGIIGLSAILILPLIGTVSPERSEQ